MSERIDISRPVSDLCRLFGLDPDYVSNMTLWPDKATVEIFRGREGRFKGSKYITDEREPAMETLRFKVTTEGVVDLLESPFDMPPLVEKEPGVDILEWLDRWKERRRQSKGHAWRRWWRA